MFVSMFDAIAYFQGNTIQLCGTLQLQMGNVGTKQKRKCGLDLGRSLLSRPSRNDRLPPRRLPLRSAVLLYGGLCPFT